MSSRLYAYTITANVRRKKDEHLKLDDLHGDEGGGELLDSFDAAVVQDAEWPLVEGEVDTRRAIFRVEDVCASPDDPRIRFGRVRATRHAVRHDVEQAASGDVIPILERDREGRPVFFWIVVPTGSTSALLLTERHSRFRIVTSFWEGLLLGRLRDDFPDATFKLAYYMPHEVWEQYRDHGRGVRGAILRRAMVETREDRELDDPTRRRTIGTITTRIDRSIAPPTERVADIIRRADREDAIELVLGDSDDPIAQVEDYDEVALQVFLEDRPRTIVIGRDRVPQLGYEVTNVASDQEGYPRIDDMASFASDLAMQIGDTIGIG